MKKINYQNYTAPRDYFKFNEGETEKRIRIISDGLLGYKHGTKAGGKFIDMGLCTEDESCENCKKGYPPKRTWRWIVFDFSDKSVHVLDVGPMLGNQICTLGGDPKDFDILIKKVGGGLKSRYTAEKLEEAVAILEDPKKLSFDKRVLVAKYFRA